MPTAGEYKHEPHGIPCNCFIRRRARQTSFMKSCLRSETSSSSHHSSLSSGDRSNSRNGTSKKVTFNPILSVRNYDDEIVSDFDKHLEGEFSNDKSKIECCSLPSRHSTGDCGTILPDNRDRFSLTIRDASTSALEQKEQQISWNEVDITVACVNSSYGPSNHANCTYGPFKLSDQKHDAISPDKDSLKSAYVNCQELNDVGTNGERCSNEDLRQVKCTHVTVNPGSRNYSRKTKCANLVRFFSRLICSSEGLAHLQRDGSLFRCMFKLLQSRRIFRMISAIIFCAGFTFLIILGYVFLYS